MNKNEKKKTINISSKSESTDFRCFLLAESIHINFIPLSFNATAGKRNISL